ncbi:MAG: ribonuclease HI [Nitrospirae bacterium]|nr:ribonuclease HI [Nitrospirota bacterium]
MPEVSIYTDGACIGNPGPGGYGAILVYGSKRKELSGGFRLTTNNRMEIMAVISALSALNRKCSVTVYSDSRLVVDSMSKGWAKKWRINGWKRSKDEPALNADLWEKLLGLCEEHRTRFVWVEGHSGHTENERCDSLSKDAARNGNLPPDKIYEDKRANAVGC